MQFLPALINDVMKNFNFVRLAETFCCSYYYTNPVIRSENIIHISKTHTISMPVLSTVTLTNSSDMLLCYTCTSSSTQHNRI